MSHAAAMDERELVHILLGSGLTLEPRFVPSAGQCRVGSPGPGRIQLTPGAGAGIERMGQVLGQAGYLFETVEGSIVVTGRNLNHDLLLRFELPLRLETLNPQVRTHWSEKRRAIKALALEVFHAVPHQQRPRTPLDNIEIEIDRFSTKEPDQENLMSCSKWLLDLMQPFHEKTRPYGLGWIREDASSCLKDCRVRHVESKQARTDVRIYRAKPAFPRIAA